MDTQDQMAKLLDDFNILDFQLEETDTISAGVIEADKIQKDLFEKSTKIIDQMKAEAIEALKIAEDRTEFIESLKKAQAIETAKIKEAITDFIETLKKAEAKAIEASAKTAPEIESNNADIRDYTSKATALEEAKIAGHSDEDTTFNL